MQYGAGADQRECGRRAHGAGGYMEANVDAGVAEQESVYNNSRAVSGVTFVLVLVFFVVAVIGSVRTVVNPVKSVTTQLNDILKEIESGNGDLTRRISLKNKDEIGQLAGGINVFLETLQQIMSRIVIDSGRWARSYRAFRAVSAQQTPMPAIFLP